MSALIGVDMNTLWAGLWIDDLAGCLPLIQNALMYEMSTTDALNGIWNRRNFFNQGERDLARPERNGMPLTVMMIDIDKFKSVNDRWGHFIGDQVIADMARNLTRQLRQADLGARLGGEEFVVVLSEIGLMDAMHLAERIRQDVAASEIVGSKHSEPVRYTVSIGLATLEPGVQSFDELLQQADRALYKAKYAGRNRICSLADQNIFGFSVGPLFLEFIIFFHQLKHEKNRYSFAPTKSAASANQMD